MGTKVFITEEDRQQNRRRELEVRARSLWANFAEEYKKMPFDYFFCLQEKKQRGLKLHKLPVTVEDYPNLPLLRYYKLEDVDNFIKHLTTVELSTLVEETEDAVYHHYVLCSLREWLRDAKYLINRSNEERLRKEQLKKSSTPPKKVGKNAVSPWG